MKHTHHFSKVIVLVGILLLPGISARAQSNLFGSSHTIDSVTYNWDSSSEDGTYHTDTYVDSTNTSNSLTIQGLIEVATLGEISGAFTGYYQNGSYLPYTQAIGIAPANLTYNGRNYDSYSGSTTYAVDLINSAVTSSFVYTYSGPSGSFTATGPNGPITGSESGWVVDGSFYVDTSYNYSWTLSDQQDPSSLFGTIYYVTSVSESTTYYQDGSSASSYSRSFQSVDGGNYSESWDDTSSYVTTSGNDPYVGSWETVNGTDLHSSPQFSNRSAPAFVQVDNTTVLWVNGTVVNSTYSTIDDADGHITDYWSDGSGSITVVTTGYPRSFQTTPADAGVWVTVNGTAHGGSISKSGGFGTFTPAVDIQVSDPNRGAPLFTVGTLYVDGVPFAFEGGFEDSGGNRTDTYMHTSGILKLIGAASDPSSASVALSLEQTCSGTFAAGIFTVPDHAILTLAEVNGPPAFWLAASLYKRTPGSNTYSTTGSPVYSVTLSGDVPASLSLAGTHASGAVGGSYNAELSGVFALSVNGTTQIACPAENSGALKEGPGLPDAAEHPECADFPPAAKVEGVPWDFLGVAPDDDAPSSTAAYYGITQATAPAGYLSENLLLLKISTEGGSSHTVKLKNYALSQATAGTYDDASRLFHTNAGAADKLLFPIQSVLPPANSLWLITPPAGTNLPPTFIVRGQPWWFAGLDGTGTATYRGFYDGQEMTLAAPDAAGSRLVTLVDTVHNGNDTPTNGTLSNVRGSVRLRDGTVVLSGNETGQQTIVAVQDDFKLQTIASDLDIVGNNLSFGILDGDASLAGALFQFQDRAENGSFTASLRSILSRQLSEWTWEKAGASASDPIKRVMQLDELHMLNLYPPDDSGVAGIVLDPSPSGTSRIKGNVSVDGKLRVYPAGDLQMGVYHKGIKPDGTEDPGS